ncbi:MAG: bifunctional adenosylcobinamide kinase/adenosylcobinamide-phosphate guanylyltransferase [Oscillospiraceae bacterium]|nr:bifunctional adenosylcobinamide kinase/adenosylcobinamide-phosphate guanylyltransferase [Oscillospiraceae bacterium]
MGKMILISGPNGSGKSALAEKLTCRMSGERYYIATMIPSTGDNLQRIEKHRASRAGLGFTTLELPEQVDRAEIGPGSAVLLEDASNLLANEIFNSGGSAEGVYEEILSLQQRCALLTVVTIAGLEDGAYEGETADYICALNRLNSMLYERADTAIEIIDRKPYLRKGGADEIL